MAYLLLVIGALFLGQQPESGAVVQKEVPVSGNSTVQQHPAAPAPAQNTPAKAPAPASPDKAQSATADNNGARSNEKPATEPEPRPAKGKRVAAFWTILPEN